MRATTPLSNDKSQLSAWQIIKAFLITVFVGFLFAGIIVILYILQTPIGAPVTQLFQSLFAMDSVQAWWYVTRAAGLTSYFLLWFSMIWGLAISSKIFHPAIEGTFSYDFHEFLSLLGLGFILLHVIVLMLDRYLPFSIWQVLIPFTDSYRPLWVGLGIIGFYITLLVTVTFYMRQQIGTSAFRSIHVLSLLGYLVAVGHGLFAGTDSALPITKWMYALTFLVVVFLIVYWLVVSGLHKAEKAQAKVHMMATTRRPQIVRSNQRW